MLVPNRGGLSVTDSGALSPEKFRDNLEDCRLRWTASLGLDSQASLFTVAEGLSAKIMHVLHYGEKSGADLRTLKSAVRDASKLGSFNLLCSSSLNGVTLERMHHLKDDKGYWTQRLVGEMRSTLSGLTDAKSIKAALAVLASTEELKFTIGGPVGYRRVAEMFCQGNMQKAFKLMSAVCKSEALDFKKLEWGAQFAGTTKEFAALCLKVRAEFAGDSLKGLVGYVAFADSYCQGSMLKAFKLMSAVCKSEALDFKKLEWGACFPGTTKEFKARVLPGTAATSQSGSGPSP